jgi:hypothetical protein
MLTPKLLARTFVLVVVTNLSGNEIMLERTINDDENLTYLDLRLKWGSEGNKV